MHIMTADGWKQLAPRECEPAQGEFRRVPLALAQSQNAVRVKAYCAAVEAYLREEIDFEMIYRPWAEPMYGAYGELIR
jgi:hypothetical protein